MDDVILKPALRSNTVEHRSEKLADRAGSTNPATRCSPASTATLGLADPDNARANWNWVESRERRAESGERSGHRQFERNTAKDLETSKQIKEVGLANQDL